MCAQQERGEDRTGQVAVHETHDTARLLRPPTAAPPSSISCVCLLASSQSTASACGEDGGRPGRRCVLTAGGFATSLTADRRFPEAVTTWQWCRCSFWQRRVDLCGLFPRWLQRRRICSASQPAEDIFLLRQLFPIALHRRCWRATTNLGLRAETITGDALANSVGLPIINTQKLRYVPQTSALR